MSDKFYAMLVPGRGLNVRVIGGEQILAANGKLYKADGTFEIGQVPWLDEDSGRAFKDPADVQMINKLNLAYKEALSK